MRVTANLEEIQMKRRIARVMLVLACAIVPAAACSDNAEDHGEEAQEEAQSGDAEEAREEAGEAERDLEEGDTTELRN